MELIGDPLLALRHPERIDLAVSATAVAGDDLVVRARVPFAGKISIELVAPLGANRDVSGVVPVAKNDEATLAAYHAANNVLRDATEADADGGVVTASLKIPAGAEGPHHIRAYLHSKTSFALGSTALQVQPRQAP
jgi:hypothetical protein